MKRMQLKKGTPNIEIMNGPFAGKKYRHGETYGPKEVPQGDQPYADRFEPVPEKKPSPGNEPKHGGKQTPPTPPATPPGTGKTEGGEPK